MAEKMTLLQRCRRRLGMSYWEPTPPPPDCCNTPLSIDMWNVIAAPRLDPAAVNDVLLRHAPAVFVGSMRYFAQTSGAANEADLYEESHA